jgi:hypothetical protein
VNTLQKLKQEAEKYGLVINQNKTKYMRHTRMQTYGKEIEIETEGMKIEEVKNVINLGTTVTKDSLIEEEIKERIANKMIFQSKLITKWKPYATRPKGRPRLRWEDDARNDLRKMGVKNWKQRAQERKQWKEIIEQAKTYKEL